MSLMEILDETRVYGKSYYTHVSMGEVKGCFCIGRDRYEKLYDSLNKESHSLAEVPQLIMPLLVDIDLKIQESIGDNSNDMIIRLYTEYQLESVVRDYQEVIKTVVKDYRNEHSMCFVLEKPAYSIEKNGITYIKNGFHLHFPYLFLHKDDIITHIFPRVRNLLNKSKAFKNLGFENAGDDLLDTDCIRNPWLMYEGCKSNASGVYKLTTIYDYEREQISLEEALRNYKIYDSNELEIDISGKEEKYLNRVLSIIPWFREASELKQNLQPIIKHVSIKENYKGEEINIDIDYDLDDNGCVIMKRTEQEKEQMIEKLNLVNLTRFKERNTWICLCYIMKGNGLPRDLFLKYSKDSGYEFYNEDECLKLWLNLDVSDSKTGFKTIHKWLDEDGVDWKLKFSPKNILASHTDEDFALYIIDKLKGEYLYDELLNEVWFYDNKNTIWTKREAKEYIITIISSTLKPLIENSIIPDCYIDKLKDDTQDIIKVKKEKYKKKLLKEIESASFILRLSKLIVPRLKISQDGDFIRKTFDSKNGLFPIANNKVIILATGELRDRQKEDYFTKTTNRRIIDVDEKEEQYILGYYESLLYNPKTGIKVSQEYRDSLIYSIAYTMTGENNLKKFINLIGERDGGKSSFLSLHQKILGNFSDASNRKIFVKSKNESCHDTEYFSLIGKRMCSVSETENGQKVNEQLVKSVSGKDMISIRKAGSDTNISLKFFTVLWLATNNPLLGADEAFMSRLMCYNFCNIFAKDESVVNKNENELIDHFFTIICRYAKSYYENNKSFVIPDEVSNYTKYICDRQDTIKLWIETDKSYEIGTDTDICERSMTYDDYCNFMVGVEEGTKLGKIGFFRKFESYFNLPEAIKIKRGGKSFMGYKGLKKVISESSSSSSVVFE